MTKRFFKHKLLFDENMPGRSHFPKLNQLFDVKHIVLDYKFVSLPDAEVYELAKNERRLLVTQNIKDFVDISKETLGNKLVKITQDFCVIF